VAPNEVTVELLFRFFRRRDIEQFGVDPVERPFVSFRPVGQDSWEEAALPIQPRRLRLDDLAGRLKQAFPVDGVDS